MSSDSFKDYSKPPLLIQQQIDLLRSRRMNFLDEEKAKDELSRISFYRLRGYWISFEDKVGDPRYNFKSGTDFEDILSLYNFDEALRNTLLYHLGKLEIYLRAKFSYHLATDSNDPLAYRNESNFSTRMSRNQRKKKAFQNRSYESELARLDINFTNSREYFAQEIRKRYRHPPVWAVVEVISFGQLVHWCRNLESVRIMEEIGKSMGLPNKRLFKSFLQCALALRNICAHQNRLVNRDLSVHPVRPKIKSFGDSWNVESNKSYNLMILMAYAMPHIDDRCNLKGDIQLLAHKYGISLEVLGFPSDWESRPVWLD